MTERHISIIIPAHNEETVIGRCLKALLDGAAADEFDIIVVANGCSDRTADVAKAFPGIRVIEFAEGSKVKALHAGNAAAHAWPRLYVDADLEIAAADVRALAAAVSDDTHDAAIGRMVVDLGHSSLAVRAFYGCWMLHPYFDSGKFGGVYSLSEAAGRRMGDLPLVTNDDEFVRRSIPPARVAFVPQASFVAKAPQTIEDLIKVRTRVTRGNRQLAVMQVKRGSERLARLTFLARVLMRPSVWPGFALFLIVGVAARMRAAAKHGWERDQSSRPALSGDAV